MSSRLLLSATLSLFIGACSADAGDASNFVDARPGADRPDANPLCTTSTLSYDSFGKGFIASYCLTCHSVSSNDRQGAPSGYDFDTFAEIEGHKEQIRFRAGENIIMPPSGPGTVKPSSDERAQLVEWLDCGPVN